MNAPADLPANAGNALNTIYQEYQAFVRSQGRGPFTSTLAHMITLEGASVGISIRGKSRDGFDAFVASLKRLGMRIETSSADFATIVGMLPIDQLPTVASDPRTLSVTPGYLPVKGS